MPTRIWQGGTTNLLRALGACGILLTAACARPTPPVDRTATAGGPLPTLPAPPTASDRAGFLPAAQQDAALIQAIRHYVEAGGGDYKGDCFVILSLIVAPIDPGARYCSFVRPPRGDSQAVVLLDLSESEGDDRVTFRRQGGSWIPVAVRP